MDKLQWWGYLHTNGTIHIKRYFGALDTDEARESPFCKVVVGPVSADNRDEAEVEIKKRLEEQK